MNRQQYQLDSELKIHLGKPTGLSWPELIYSLPDKEFRRLTRSTLSVLNFWMEADQRILEVLNQLGFESSSSGNLCFEYSVPSLGINNPSFTDVMYFSETVRVGFEGKYTEPRYETVEKWLGERPSANKSNVLNHWLSLIQPFSASRLEAASFFDVVYQMLHRLASVCYETDPESSSAAMVYKVFVDEGEPHVDYETDLKEFCALVQPVNSLRIALQVIEQTTLRTYDDLNELLATHGENVSAVRRALLSAPWFEFQPQPLLLIS